MGRYMDRDVDQEQKGGEAGERAFELRRARIAQEAIPAWYSGPLHLVLLLAVGGGAVGFALATLERPGWPLALVALATFLAANLVEYWGHRVPMHRRIPGLGAVYRRHVGQHHAFFIHRSMALREPREMRLVLFPSVLVGFFLGLVGTPIGLAVAVLGGADAARVFAATAIGYYLNYELLHLLYHAPSTGLPGRLAERLGRRHRLHHDPALMGRYNFNITYPIGDWIFGTVYRDASRKSRMRLAVTDGSSTSA